MSTIYTGIDVGTYHVKVIIARADRDQPLHIIGIGMAASRGMRHGYILNARDAAQGIKDAVDKASGMAKVQVKSAYVGIGGVGIGELRSSADVSLTASGGEVTDRDVEHAIRESERRASSQLVNLKVLHAIPLSFKVDGSPVLGRVVGLKGAKLSVTTLLITTLEQHLHDLIETIESLDIAVDDIMVAPLAASLVTLTKPQKMAGVVLANIGAETLSIAVFENDTPISIKVFPTGSSDITHQLALTLQVPIPEAEQIKRGAITNSDAPRKKIDDAISLRLKDMFGLIDAHLKQLGKQRLLPAGIVITGGGSGITTARDIARATLRIPSQTGTLPPTALKTATADATWAVAYGLCKWGHTTEQRDRVANFGSAIQTAFSQVISFFRNLLP